MPGWINIPVKVETRERLDKFKATTTQSYDSLINELLNEVNQHRNNKQALPNSDKGKPTT